MSGTAYSIIIPAYNEEALLPRTLGSAQRAMAAVSDACGEIIVVDNACTDRTALVARQAGARVVWEPHRQIARARNAGGRAARGRYLIFLDADTTLPAPVLRRTLDALGSGRFCGGGARIVFDRPLPPALVGLTRVWHFLSRVCLWAAGSYVFCLREAFEGTGGFDQRYYASEEIHFSRALKRWGRSRGLGFVVLNEAPVTSVRKLDWFTWRGIVRAFWRIACDPSLLHSRQGCALWYERPGEPSRSAGPKEVLRTDGSREEGTAERRQG